MTIDLGFVLYLENAVLTAGVAAAMLFRGGNGLFVWKDEAADAPPPLLIIVFGFALWPLFWLGAAVAVIGQQLLKFSRQTA